MKMQNKKLLKPGLLLLLFGALMAAFLLPLRIWQQIYLVEPDSGFWVASNHNTVTMLYVAMGALIVIPTIAAIFTRKKMVLDIDRRPRVVEGFFALMVGAAILASVAVALHFAFSIFSGQMIVEGVRPIEGQMMQYYIRSGVMAALLEALFGVGAALFFGNLGIINLFPDKKLYLNRLLLLMPALWVVARLLRRFSRTIAYLRVSDLFITLAALVLLMIFFLAFAQTLGGINNKNRVWRLVATGVPAAILLLLTFVPRMVAYDIIGGVAVPPDALREITDPTIALFLCVFLFSRLRCKTSEETVLEQTENQPEEQAETP